MKHVYLSPHLDDAVLSCGGAIHRQVSAGDSVTVVTVFSGEAGAHGVALPLSPFALLQHTYWGRPPRPMALRRAEDAAALTLLSAQWYHMGHLDAVYRSSGGAWLYTDLDSLFDQVDDRDPMIQAGADLSAQLAGFLPRSKPATIYAPLAVGRHVDHQIVHSAACRLLARGRRVAFYEDYPYAGQPGALDAGLQAAGASGWRDQLIGLQPPDVAAWVTAIGYYRSQLGVLFRGADAMPNAVWAFAGSRSPEQGLATRLWWPPER